MEAVAGTAPKRMSGHVTRTLQGPAWSAPGLDIAAGRYPLAVERHVMRMADLLVPGVTTVTPHARYYALHALIADEAASRVPTDRLKQMPMTVGDWLTIEASYDRRRRGLREKIVAPHVLIEASTAPSKVGELLSLVGVERWARKLDDTRKVAPGETEAFLDRVTKGRNRIAHNGDRQGCGRANLTIDEVRADLARLESVVQAIEKVV